MGAKRGPLVDRFWAKVEKNAGEDDCWIWTARRLGTMGYGGFSPGSQSEYPRTMLAHRMSWILANGPIPDGMLVLHRCDNPPCVNPAHLFLGTNADNMADCIAKGRFKVWNRPNGDRCINGHERDPADRRCRPCVAEAGRRWAERHPDAARDRYRRYGARRAVA